MAYNRNPSGDLVYDPDSGQYVPATVSYTLTVDPTPSDATVVLTATGFTQDGNSITVDENTTVAYTVSKTGYTTISGVVVVTQTQTLSIVLSLPVIQEISISGTVYDIQSKSVVNKNTSNATLSDVKFWVGTNQEYIDQQIETAHPEYFSGITDAVTINTGFDIVEFQLPTAENNYTWYKKYRNNWVEQGGIVTQGRETKTHTMAVAMSDTNYTLFLQQTGTSSNYGYGTMVTQKTTTTFTVYSNEPGNQGLMWEVKGIAASE